MHNSTAAHLHGERHLALDLNFAGHKGGGRANLSGAQSQEVFLVDSDYQVSLLLTGGELSLAGQREVVFLAVDHLRRSRAER